MCRDALFARFLVTSAAGADFLACRFEWLLDHPKGPLPLDLVRCAAGRLQEPPFDRGMAHHTDRENILALLGATTPARFHMTAGQRGAIAAARPLAAESISLDDFGDIPAHRFLGVTEGRRKVMRAQRLRRDRSVDDRAR